MPKTERPGEMPATDFDLALRCDHFVSMVAGVARVERDIFLGTRGQRIARVAPWAQMHSAAGEPKYRTKRFINAQDRVVMPGLVNAHSHLPMTLFRGLADDLPFQRWLNECILPLENRIVDPEFVRLGAELAIAESLLAGTTQIYDMYFFEDEIAQVAERTGIRAWVGENIFDFEAPDNKGRTGNDWKILERTVERYTGHARVHPFIAPHAPYSCSDDTLRRSLKFAQDKNCLLGIHVSETEDEVDRSLKEHKVTPIARLHNLGLMEHPCLFAHAVHPRAGDMDLLVKTQTPVVNNPECNLKLGSGIAPVAEYLRRGIVVALGTDGAASNNDLSLFKEMDCAAKVQKHAAKDNTAMTAATALQMATWNGARAFRRLDDLGSLEEGKIADFIVVSLDAPHMQPVHNVISHLVYSASGAEVESVVVDGTVVVDRRQLLTIDLKKLYTQIADFRARVGF